ncbi:MAG: Fe-S cluster assembly protein SufB, partial [Olsenella sp.]|nr:Fe-S cluster assembly protein SufB [Olsenella sp.]
MTDTKDTSATLEATGTLEPRLDEKGRSVVADVDRSLYDFTKSEEGYERYDDGLTPETVRAISARKDEPEWMLEMRLKALDVYHSREMAENWGPSIEGLDLDHISTYVSPNTKQARDWEDVPEDIKDTFERLGIPQAERESLAGVGAQYDSEIVYHNMREEVAKYGVVYTTIEDALHDPEWEPVVHEYFGRLIPM